MVRFTFRFLLDQPFTSGLAVCNSRGDLFISACEFVIKAPGVPTKGLRSICIVGRSLISLGLTCAWSPSYGSSLHRGRESSSQCLSSSVVQGTTALLFVPGIRGATGCLLVVNAGWCWMEDITPRGLNTFPVWLRGREAGPASWACDLHHCTEPLPCLICSGGPHAGLNLLLLPSWNLW